MIRAFLTIMLDGPTVTLTLANLLSDISTVLTSLLSWVIDIFNTMMASPIVVIFIVMALIGTAVAFARKLLK